MKFQFKVQQYQTDAVDAVVGCLAGQPRHDGISYRIDPGRPASSQPTLYPEWGLDSGLRNAKIALSPTQLLENIHAVQRSRNLPLSAGLVDSKAGLGVPNLDVEMETGTGKTYVYIKTMMELHKRYGWSKYIVVVPNVSTVSRARKLERKVASVAKRLRKEVQFNRKVELRRELRNSLAELEALTERQDPTTQESQWTR
jgi:type III restriction enzyme